MSKLDIYTSITSEGKLPAIYRDKLVTFLAANKGKDCRLRIDRGRKRSLKQNAFMHGPFLEAMGDMYREFGNDYQPELVKAIFKRKFGPKMRVEEPNGDHSYQDIPSSEWTVAQCEEAMDLARAHYVEFYALPFPNEPA